MRVVHHSLLTDHPFACVEPRGETVVQDSQPNDVFGGANPRDDLVDG
jgi:hypothetical protein